MHILQLRITNIACFDDVMLDFTDDSGKPCQWVVLLGENGTGKSTALQSVIPALPTINPWQHSLVDMPFRHLLRSRADEGRVAIVVKAGAGDTNRRAYPLETVISRSTGRTAVDDEELHSNHEGNRSEKWFTAAYRPWRGGRRFIDESANSGSYANPAPIEDRFASMFDDYSRTTPIREWLADLDYRRLKLKETSEQESERAQAVFYTAVRAIEAIFPNTEIRFKEVTPTKDVIFLENDLLVGLDSLSDGYRSAINWIGDLVRRLVDAFPDMENPLHAYGVVLVDEIDLHLHPKWQRSIIGQIRQVFPNLQFIVTTHSPFIAQEMTEKDKLIVLRRDGDKVTATEDKGFVQGWRVDQILTSYLFGLGDTRGKDIEEAELARRELLDSGVTNGLTSEEHKKLTRVREIIAEFKSSPDERATPESMTDAELRRAANDLLKIIASRNAPVSK